MDQIARMFNDAFAHFKGEIQAGKARVRILKYLDDAERVLVVVEGVT